jgi:predicted Zn-dependent peptidase
MSIQTPSGLASYLATLATSGLAIDYVREFPATVSKLDRDAVLAAARTYLVARRLSTVLVGDVAAIRPVVELLGDVELDA